jgi:hypothetical protein
MANKILHIIITCCLLLSITEFSKVALLLYSSIHDNGCSVLMCTCSTSCSCSGHASKEQNRNEIPLLIPVEKPSSGSCCPAPNTSDTHSQARVCSCGSSENPAGTVFVQSLDKVTFIGLQSVSLFNNFSDRFFSEAPLLKQNPYPSDIFHPPKNFL